MNKKFVASLLCLISLTILLSINPAKAAITTWYFEQMYTGQSLCLDELAYDSSGNPGSVSFDWDNKKIYFTYKTSTGWQTEFVDNGIFNCAPSLEYFP